MEEHPQLPPIGCFYLCWVSMELCWIQEKTWSSYKWIDKWGQSVSTFGKNKPGSKFEFWTSSPKYTYGILLKQQQHIEKNIIPSFILNVFGVLIKILSMAKIIIKNDSELNNVL